MKTRTFLGTAALAAIALLTVSCFWQPAGSSGSGSVSFTMSPRTMARWASGAAPEILRVYVMAPGNVLVPFGPAAHPYYDELSFSAGTLAVSYASPPVPVGGPYSVLVAVGKEMSGVFTPTDYGQADGVTVTVGASTAASVTLSASPFFDGTTTSTTMWGMTLAGLAVIEFASPVIYAATSGSLYSMSGTRGTVTTESLLPAGYTINSLSVGEKYAAVGSFTKEPWMNTNLGIVPFPVGGSANTTFAASPSKVNVLQSASLNDGSAGQVVVYERQAGLGGVVLAAGSVTPPWIDIDLSNFLTGKPILDFVSTTGYIYFATSLGTFQVPKSIIASGETPEQVFNAATFIKVNQTGPEIPILSLAINGGVIYMGTADGVYTATFNEPPVSGAAIGAATQIAATAGKAIRKVKAYSNRVAFLSDTDVFVIDGYGVLHDLPFYCGLPADVPGDIRDIEFYSSAQYVLISGKKGLVAYQVPGGGT